MSDGLAGRSGHFETSRDEQTRGTVRDTHEVVFDEPEFLPVAEGDDTAPSPVDYLLSSLAGCQLSVLDQCLKKSRVEDYHVTCDATITEVGEGQIPEEMPGNTANRIHHVDVEITLTVPEADESRARRCAEVYDVGCIVGQSLRAGVDYDQSVTVELDDPA